jgi:HK97 family phage prohead protease
MDLVKRQYHAALGAVKRSDEDQSLRVSGHAAVFGQRTVIGSTRHGFVEQVHPKAMADVLDDDVRYLENHDGLPLARTKSGTMQLSIDNVGLRTDADLNPVAGLNHFSAIERGDLDQMSFAFTIELDEVRQLPSDDPDFPDMVERTILKVGRLYDVSGVTFPAYEGADVGVRSMNIEDQEREIRSVLDRAATIPEVSELELSETESDVASEIRSDDSQTEDVPMSVERAKALAAADRRPSIKESSNG